jgi:hypothetical protein
VGEGQKRSGPGKRELVVGAAGIINHWKGGRGAKGDRREPARAREMRAGKFSV